MRTLILFLLLLMLSASVQAGGLIFTCRMYSTPPETIAVDSGIEVTGDQDLHITISGGGGYPENLKMAEDAPVFDFTCVPVDLPAGPEAGG